MNKRLIILSVLIMFLLAACKPAPTPTPTDLLEPIRTAAAQTVNAMTTDIVATSNAGPANPSETPQPSGNPAQKTPLPPATLLPFTTPTITNQDSAQSNCDLAEFIDETIPDGTIYSPGAKFIKTWTFRNAGTCTWTSQYALVFIGGNAMGAPAAQAFTANPVKPGDSVTLSIPLTAPQVAGTQRADFKLRNAGGAIFAFKDPQKSFWAEINVQTIALAGKMNLADSICLAQWSNGTDTLPCPSKPADSAGYAYTNPKPILENNADDDENTLILGVPQQDSSFLRGTYPAFQVPQAAAFYAVFGCSGGNSACNTSLTLSYIEGNAAPKQLATWSETFDNSFQRLDLDLSFLAGKTVQFILTLSSNGTPEGDQVHLMAPIIASR
ncbi:MAG TPA: NBR1-Ig-like domain-containing protein [Anaerolineaceae bacterium]|nr:NBR1-Ig-like domain-containing protein [Anaerolineaceae bacterium]